MRETSTATTWSGRGRGRLRGSAAIAAALDRGDAPRLIVVPKGEPGPAVAALLARAEAAGVAVRRVGERQFERLRQRDPACDALALLGPPPETPFEDVLAGDGAVWLLTRVVYPGNAGFAIRTAEVSGAAGIAIDADFQHAGRREAVRAAMRADRFFPLAWEPADRVLDLALAAGRTCVAIEDVGDAAPWELDLTGRLLFVVGGEAEGIPQTVLSRCQRVIRIPMAGFLPSYNLQAAMAAVTAERLRQLEGRARGAPEEDEE